MYLHGNCYLPEDFEPDSQSGYEKGLPKGIRSNKTQSLFNRVEGSEFVMGEFKPPGSNEDPINFLDDEKNGPKVTLSSFYMQKTEVSVGEFEHFCGDGDVMLDAGNQEYKKFSDAWDELVRLKRTTERTAVRGCPATGVTHGLATRYARWIGGELPTEAQWEFAARSRGQARRYVWRDEIQGDYTVTDMANVGNYQDRAPCAVDFGDYEDRTEQGILHMAGNVREWCRNPWKKYTTTPLTDPGEGAGDGDGDKNPCYAIRGGSYLTSSNTARVTWRTRERGARYCMEDGEVEQDLGFRVVVKILECPPNLVARSESTAWLEPQR
jgi:serine/threonine-protein kinase